MHGDEEEECRKLLASHEFLECLCDLFRRWQRRAVGFRWTVRVDAGATMTVVPAKGETVMLLLTDTQKVSLSIQPVDVHGHPAVVDGAPSWSLSDTTIGTLTPAVDGMSAAFLASAPGVCQVSVTADADMGAGVTPISGALDIQIEPGAAVSLGITAGVPENQ